MAGLEEKNEPETVRLSLKSNGTPQGTVITDEHGRVVENVSRIVFDISATQPAIAQVTLYFMEAEIEADFEVKKEVLQIQKILVDDIYRHDF
jgi:hypothetical protein